MTTDTKDPYIHQTNFGKFLICNPEETIQRSLIHSGQFEIIGPFLLLTFKITCQDWWLMLVQI